MRRNVMVLKRFGWVAVVLPALVITLSGCANPYGNADCGACRGEDSCCPTPPKPCGYPPEAKPGESWCQVLIPGETKRVCEEVCVTCPSCRQEWVPPVTETKVHEVCVCPACARDITTPAVWQDLSECVQVSPGCFEQRCRRVCIQCEQTKTVYTPAQYETCVEECVICPGHWVSVPVAPVKDMRCHEVCVKPAHWEWRRNPNCEAPKPCAPPPCPPCAPPPCAPPPPPCAPPPCPPPAPVAPPAKIAGLPALQVEMTDKNLDGSEQGIFDVGDDFLYVLRVENDEATEQTPALHVVFTLPAELEFVSGSSDGVSVTGQGATARTSEFRLDKNQALTVSLRVRAKAVPRGGLLMAVASVQNGAGLELSTEAESTTLKGVPATPLAAR